MLLKISGKDSKTFLKTLSEHICQSIDNVKYLDLSEVSFVTPVICVIYSIFKFFGKKIRLPFSEEVSHYLTYMSHHALPSSGDSRYIPVIRLEFNKDGERKGGIIAGRFAEIFENFISEEASLFLRYSIAELVDNIFYHAESNHGAWLHVQKYPAAGVIELCLVDLGRGISESMKDNPEYEKLNPFSRFIYALKPGITRNPSRHTGEGLSCVVEWVRNNPLAECIIISRNHVYVKIVNSPPKSSEWIESRWPGTLIWLKIPEDPSVSLQEIWEILNMNPE